MFAVCAFQIEFSSPNPRARGGSAPDQVGEIRVQHDMAIIKNAVLQRAFRVHSIHCRCTLFSSDCPRSSHDIWARDYWAKVCQMWQPQLLPPASCHWHFKNYCRPSAARKVSKSKSRGNCSTFDARWWSGRAGGSLEYDCMARSVLLMNLFSNCVLAGGR